MLIENIEEFIVIEKRIDTAEDDAADTLRESIRDRWESGKWILTKRVGKQLPKDMIGELVTLTGKGQSELKYRMQFAEQCPTEDEVAKRLATCKDWYAVIKSLPKPKADKPTRKLAPQSDRQDIADAINEREDRGENYSAKDIVEAVGGDVSTSTVARKQSAVRAERNAAPIEWDTIPGNQREKLEHTKTSILKQLEREYHTRLLAEADQYRAECDAALAEHKSKLDAEYKRLYDVRKEDYHRYREGIELQRAKGLITPDDYTLIRSCLHPDSRNAVTDGKLAAAFRVFNDSRIKVLLVKDK